MYRASVPEEVVGILGLRLRDFGKRQRSAWKWPMHPCSRMSSSKARRTMSTEAPPSHFTRWNSAPSQRKAKQGEEREYASWNPVCSIQQIQFFE